MIMLLFRYLIALTAFIAGIGIVLSVQAFLHHTHLIKYDNFDDVERRHRPMIRACLCVAIDLILVGCSIGAMVNKWNSGKRESTIMTRFFTLFTSKCLCIINPHYLLFPRVSL